MKFDTPKNRKQFADYILSRRSDQDSSKKTSLMEILSGDLSLKTKLDEYKNLKENLNALLRLKRTKEIVNPTVLSKIKKNLTNVMNEYGIHAAENTTTEKLLQNLNELILKVQKDCDLTTVEFYHRLAWLLWTSPKSLDEDKKTAKKLLDSIWESAVSNPNLETNFSALASSLSEFKTKTIEINRKLYPATLKEAFESFKNRFKTTPINLDDRTKTLEKEFYLYYLNFCQEIFKNSFFTPDEKTLACDYVDAVFREVTKKSERKSLH